MAIAELAGLQRPGVGYKAPGGAGTYVDDDGNTRPIKQQSDWQDPDPYGEGAFYAGMNEAGYMPLSSRLGGGDKAIDVGAGENPETLKYFNQTYGLNLQNSADYYRHIYGQPNAEIVQDEQWGPLLKIGKDAQIKNKLDYNPNPNEELMKGLSMAALAFGGAAGLGAMGALGAGGGMAGAGAGAAGTLAGEVGAGAGGMMGAGGAFTGAGTAAGAAGSAGSAGGSSLGGAWNSIKDAYGAVSKFTKPLSAINNLMSLTGSGKGGERDAAGAPAGGNYVDDDYSDYFNNSYITDNWDVMGDLGAYGLGGSDSDNWDLMGNLGSYGLGGTGGTGAGAVGSSGGGGRGGGGGTGGTDWGSALNKILSASGGLYDLFSKDRLSMTGITNKGADIADPLRADRGHYGSMLKQLMADPSSYQMSSPAQFAMTQGTENLSRAGAARGLLGSGNLMGEIMKYGEGVASQDYWKQVENLGKLSGGTAGNLGQAGMIYSGLYDRRNNAAANIGGGTSGGRPTGGGGGSSGGGTSGGNATSGGGWGDVFKAGSSVIGGIKDVFSWFS